MINILKEINQEGRIKIYVLSLVAIIASSYAWRLPGLLAKAIGAISICLVYVYSATMVTIKYKKGTKDHGKTKNR